MGKIEKRLLENIGLCVPPLEYESRGIAQKAMRSVTPECGHDKHDAESRERSRQRVIEKAKAVDLTTVPIASILPEFGFHSGDDPSKQLSVRVSVSDLKAIGEKLIRGTTWVLAKAYIDTDHSIHIDFPRNPTAGPFFEDLQRYGTLYSLGTGLSIFRAASGDCQSGIFLITIWGRLHLYGCVAPVNVTAGSH
jgi:hypothetical protein